MVRANADGTVATVSPFNAQDLNDLAHYFAQRD